jgi:hypothetical protein
MQYKVTKKLFHGIYQYKIVLTCAGSSLFRHNDLDTVYKNLSEITLPSQPKPNQFGYRSGGISNQDDLDYAFRLQKTLSKMSGIDIRVESPWLSIYSNNLLDINKLAKINIDQVKYISKPPDNTTLDAGTVIMPKMNYDFRITLGKTTQEHSAFVEWAEVNKKLKLTKSCIKDLHKPRSWGGTHFYVTGDNNLLMTRMHLGGSISKVERIVKN